MFHVSYLSYPCIVYCMAGCLVCCVEIRRSSNRSWARTIYTLDVLAARLSLALISCRLRPCSDSLDPSKSVAIVLAFIYPFPLCACATRTFFKIILFSFKSRCACDSLSPRAFSLVLVREPPLLPKPHPSLGRPRTAFDRRQIDREPLRLSQAVRSADRNTSFKPKR